MKSTEKKDASELLSLIKKQRASKKREKFEGTFAEYLDLVVKDPSIVRTAHQRLTDAIESHGFEVMANDDPRKSSIFEGENLKEYTKDLIDQASLKAMNVPQGQNDLQSANNKKGFTILCKLKV